MTAAIDSTSCSVRNPWIESLLAIGSTEAMVNSLKTISGDAWDEDILLDLFSSRDRTLIKQVLLSMNPAQDQWQWHYDLRGMYSVKSGYRHLIVSQPPFPNMDVKNGLKKLWSLSIPPKRTSFGEPT